MAEVKVPTKAQALVAPFAVHPFMEERHLQKNLQGRTNRSRGFLYRGTNS